MNKYDLSVLIPARNEMFLARTIEGLLKNIRGNTEIIVVLDGAWADPGITSDPRLTVVYLSKSIGQRGATNLACKLSKAKYVMKLDAHCEVDEGFDVKLLAKMEDDYTMLPVMYNLHAFDWVCQKCGNRWYQSPTPKNCMKDGSDGKVGRDENPSCDSKEFKRDIVFKPRLHKRSTFYRFDKTLHFQYWGAFANREDLESFKLKDNVYEVMTAQGSCFLLTREKYWELDICEEKHGSWGQQGVEVAMKTWLSGGHLVVNMDTWYSHMFRTQGGDFGFPYPLSGNEVERARSYSKALFGENGHWDKAIEGRDLKWVLNKFYPVPDWHDMNEKRKESNKQLKKGIIFYTDNRVNTKMAHAVQRQIRSVNIPIVSSSLKPMDNMGKNIYMPLERGYLTMFKQILKALEESDADIIYMCEHDVLYHPSHFDFIPPTKDKFYYNINVWKVDAKSGHSLWVDVCQQVSGLVAYRELLIEEYKRRVERVEKEGKFERGWGNEPGTKSVARGGFSDITCENFKSKYPNLDIRAEHNLTPNRWKKEQFRNQSNTIGWTEKKVTEIEGWKFSKDEEFYKYKL